MKIKEIALALLILSSQILAQEGRVLESCSAYGKGKQYIYGYKWKDGVDTQKIITKITQGVTKYEYIMVGQRDFRIVGSVDGVKKPVVTFLENLAGSRLVQLKQLANDDLHILLCDIQGYRIYRFSKVKDSWEKKMMGFISMPLTIRPQDLGIKEVSISAEGNLSIIYENKEDETYIVTNNSAKITLNGVHTAHAVWYKDGKVVIAP